MPKPFSDEELKEWRKQPAYGDEKRFLATIDALKKDRDKLEGLVHINEKLNLKLIADRQQIENLKLDLHVANRALEIDPATVDLRKRIAELENNIQGCFNCGSQIHEGERNICEGCDNVNRKRIAELEIKIRDYGQALARDNRRIVELMKQAEIKASLVEGVMTLAEVHEQLEDAKAENQRLGELECVNENMRNRIKKLQAENQRLRDELKMLVDCHICRKGICAIHWFIFDKALRPKEEDCEK